MNFRLIFDVIIKLSIKELPKCIKTSMINHAVRRIHRAYKNVPSSSLLKKIFRANERLTAEHSVDQHLIKSLNIAVRKKKKRRQRGKRLNLLSEEDSGPQFYSPSKVQAARDRQAVIEEEKHQKKQAIEGKKAAATAARQQKEKKKTERMIIAAEKKKINASMKEAKLAEKQVPNKLKSKLIRQKKRSNSSEIVDFRPDNEEIQQKEKGKPPIIVEKVDEVKTSNMRIIRGRKVQRPKRFDN